MERLARALQPVPDHGQVLAVLVLRLDRLSMVTESYGHEFTSELLQRAEIRLKNLLPDALAVTRVGDREFAVMTRFNPDTTRDLPARLVEIVGRPYLLDGRALVVACSAGAAVVTASLTATELYHRATLALYQARKEGGNRTKFFDPAMAERAANRAVLEFDLRRALALQEFELHYQPQFDLSTHTLRGVEALIRWRHPERGMLAPGTFLPAAQDAGLMHQIGEWVIRTACKQAIHWPDSISVGVNVDASYLEGDRLLTTVGAALRMSGLPPNRLDVEITEGIIIQAGGAAAETLANLRAIGVQLSMDDFGTGYSSLTQLRDFPFSKIKIDRSLVKGIVDNPKGAVLLRAVAGMGAGLGMRTVAEGVETPLELKHVQAEGCTDVQGYLTGRPAPAAEVDRILPAALAVA